MKRSVGILVVVALAAVVLVACSSSSSGGSNASAACTEASIPPACYSCAESKCSSALSTYDSACSSYLSCLCPGGTYSASNVVPCDNNMTDACSTAQQSLTDCGQQNCAAPCNEGDGG